MDDYRYQQFDDYDDEINIDFGKLFRKLFKEWRFIAKWCIIGAVVGLVIAFSLPRRYKAESVMAPERTKSSSSSSLGTLASIAGISLANLSTSDAMTPDMYPTIIHSAPFIADLLSTPVEFEDKKETVFTDLYTYYKDYTRAPWWTAVISAPFKAVGWFVDLFKEKVEPVEGYSDIDTFRLTEEQTEIIKALASSISVKVDKKTYMIAITVYAQNPVVAAVLCQAVSDKLKDYLDEYHLEKAKVDLSYYEKLCEEAQSEYYAAQKKYADYVDANQGIVLRSRRIEQDRLQNEMNLKYNLYNSCAQQAQQARARIQMEIPVFAVISPATVPLKSAKPSKKMILACFIFLGALGAGVWVLGREKVKGVFQTEEEI